MSTGTPSAGGRFARATKKAGAVPASIERGMPLQAFFECDTHQPFAFTDLPGNSWHGP